MRTFAFCGMIACLSVSAVADAKAAWETSRSWLCRAEVRASCSARGICEQKPAKLLQTINFEKGQIEYFDVDAVTQIKSKSYFEDKYSGNGTFFSFAPNVTYVISDKQSEDLWEKGTYPFQMIAISTEGATEVYFGSCKPLS